MRSLVALGSVLVALASSVSIAQAAKPVKGTWSGTRSTSFEVNSTAKKISDFRPGGCAAGPLGYGPIKVRANGSFALTKRIGLQGGKPVKLTIRGTFTSTTAAKGTVKYGKCNLKFKATADNPPAAPRPPAVPDPVAPDPVAPYPGAPIY